MAAHDDFLRQMEVLYRAYVEQLPGRIEKIVELWEALCQGRRVEQTLSDLYHALHKLSGSGPTFGLAEITVRAQLLEDVLKRYMTEGEPPTEHERELINADLAALKRIASEAGRKTAEFLGGISALPDAMDAIAGNGAAPRRPRVLVADDEALLRRKLAIILNEAGFEVQEAGNGLVALELARKTGPDLVLMDFLMPVMDGIEAVRCMREEPVLKDVPVLLLTTRRKMPEVQRLYAELVDGYLAKPFRPDEVIERVRDVLGYPPDKQEHGARSILIADDHGVYRKTVALLLRRAGFQVEEAENGLQALQMAVKRRPDLVLLDVIMPVMDGMEAIRRMRQEESLRDVPIILFTANIRTSDVPKAFRYGVDAYIAKPLTADQMLEKVKMHLGMQ